jgi:dihydropteroate synthase
MDTPPADALAPPAASWAGLPLDRPRLMGVVNATPDSFSDGGDRLDPGAAVAAGVAMAAAGADLVDVGGESTRPGAAPVDPAEEWRRVGPVVAGLVRAGVRVSADTRHAATMRRAIDAGAAAVNDVTALAGDPDALSAVAGSGVSVCLMHMRGDPRTMQESPRYADVVAEVRAFLAGRVRACLDAGIGPERICVDPGVGFGKTDDHNLALIRAAGAFAGLGVAVLYGVSRKSLVARLSRGEPPKDRLPGSIVAGLAALDAGAHWLRVHDVAETAQALAVRAALRAAPASGQALPARQLARP